MFKLKYTWELRSQVSLLPPKKNKKKNHHSQSSFSSNVQCQMNKKSNVYVEDIQNIGPKVPECNKAIWLNCPELRRRFSSASFSIYETTSTTTPMASNPKSETATGWGQAIFTNGISEARQKHTKQRTGSKSNRRRWGTNKGSVTSETRGNWAYTSQRCSDGKSLYKECMCMSVCSGKWSPGWLYLYAMVSAVKWSSWIGPYNIQ